MKNVLIVESPAKAKTINKYLGSDYKVLASFGHIRDLPAKSGSVKPDEDFVMDWEVEEKGEKRIKEIASTLKDADNLILATDPDREGEAIAWHVAEELGKRGKLKGLNVSRVTFNEITKNAVTTAINNPREIDTKLVDAYLARRALDYLVGFTLSPVLWHKLPGSRSAGRVQSVALRLICERENEIEDFKSEEYWTVKGNFLNSETKEFSALLTHFDSQKLDKFAINNEAYANTVKTELEKHNFNVQKIEKKTVKRNPVPPFTTSTLQQEAARKLYMSTKKTMQIAQQLYEGIDIGGETIGLITYMRTDGIQMANEAILSCRSLIENNFGKKYIPEAPRYYKNTVKNAQEAHEAIRPTDVFRTPSDLASFLNKDQFRLYELIWKRTVASQMASADIAKSAVDITSENKAITFRATGQIVSFDGFLKIYFEDLDDKKDDENNALLPLLTEGEALTSKDFVPEQHFTQPPPRYSEASLVKKLEELGIGRPSTYASIISVLQDRDYVRLDNRKFIPEDRGKVVTVFLENFFAKYVQYDFTASLENELDEISEGKMYWKQTLKDFWADFNDNIKKAEELNIPEVLNRLEESLCKHIFLTDDDKICPECKKGKLELKMGKFGAFIGCSEYPSCPYTRPLTEIADKENASGTDEALESSSKLLGTDKNTGLEITLRKGPYGFYVQMGEVKPKAKKSTKTTKTTKGSKTKKASLEADKVIENKNDSLSENKPDEEGKRVSIPKNIKPEEVDLNVALGLLKLPRTLGTNPNTNDTVITAIGRFGPYVKSGTSFKSLSPTDNVLTIDLTRALELLAETKKSTAKEIGTHPDGGVISVGSGRFGPYVKYGKVYASIPKNIQNENRNPTLDEAILLLKAKQEKSAAKPKGKKEKK